MIFIFYDELCMKHFNDNIYTKKASETNTIVLKQNSIHLFKFLLKLK